MHIFLYGPSGSGKTTVGKILADSLELLFIDLDTHLEVQTGKSIPDLMNADGENAFREIESRALQNALNAADAVVALGGGSLLRAENRTMAEAKGEVVFLEAGPHLLGQRLQQDRNNRPLLAGDLGTALNVLFKERQSHYESFPLRVDASPAPERVAADIQCTLGRHRLRAMDAPYDALVQPGGLDQLGMMLKKRALDGPLMLVSDDQVAPLYAQRALSSLRAGGYDAHLCTIPAGETHKNVASVTSLWKACLQAGLDRRSTVIALGGGVVSDLAGFAAATYMRGCAWAAVPTTLLAMVDASLGGKTGFDLPEGKNLAGAFWPPRLVLADPELLSSLPERELCAGLAEVVKHGLIADPGLFALCARGWEAVKADLPQVVRRAQAVKVKLIEADPYEKGQRAALNFGHTIGHAVELVSEYRLRHGEAVAVGMLVEARLAERLGIAEKGLSNAIMKTLSGLGLPVAIPPDVPRENIYRAVQVDKKKADGQVRFALPLKIGEVKTGIAVNDLADILEDL